MTISDYKAIETDEPIATNRATRRKMEKQARKKCNSATPKGNKKTFVTTINPPLKTYKCQRRGVWNFY